MAKSSTGYAVASEDGAIMFDTISRCRSHAIRAFVNLQGRRAGWDWFQRFGWQVVRVKIETVEEIDP